MTSKLKPNTDLKKLNAGIAPVLKKVFKKDFKIIGFQIDRLPGDKEVFIRLTFMENVPVVWSHDAFNIVKSKKRK